MSGASIADGRRDCSGRAAGYGPEQRTKLVVAIALACLCMVSLIGNAYLPFFANSGRYLLRVLRIMDPGLFPSDPVADSLERFSSLFYIGLGNAMAVLRLGPGALPAALLALYVTVRVSTVVVLYAMVLDVSRSRAAALLAAAWACHPVGVPVGGISLFMPMITHAEVAFLAGLLAFRAWLHRRYAWFWIAMSFAMFVHSILAIQLAFCLVPPMLLARAGDPAWRKWRLVGPGLLCASALVYGITLRPPALSADEASIFWQAKGGMAHVSLLAQSKLAWCQMLLTLVAAWFVTCRLLRWQAEATLILRACVAGGLGAVVLSLAATVFRITTLALVQPVRTFMWVAFLCNVLLAVGAARALSQRSPAGILLLGYLLLAKTGSLWAWPLLAGAVVFMVVPCRVAGAKLIGAWPRRRGWALVTVFLGSVIAGRLAGFVLTIETLTDWQAPVLAAALLVLSAYQSSYREPQELGETTAQSLSSMALALSVAVALVGASLDTHEYYRVRTDGDWSAMTDWCREHTSRSTRFLTPPHAPFFRVAAQRTSANEEVSALAWVNPIEYRRNSKIASAANSAYASQSSTRAQVTALARDLGCSYTVLSRPLPGNTTSPLFRAGRYAVYATGQLAPPGVRALRPSLLGPGSKEVAQ